MRNSGHHTLHNIAALPVQSPMISKRLGYAMSSSIHGKHLNLKGIDRIQKSSVLINLIITNLCLILAVFFEPKALFLSTAILGALASGLGIFIVSYSKKTHSSAEICMLGMLIVYITFFTLVAASLSVLSITIV